MSYLEICYISISGLILMTGRYGYLKLKDLIRVNKNEYKIFILTRYKNILNTQNVYLDLAEFYYKHLL